MNRVAKPPARGAFDACETVVEIDWSADAKAHTTLGVIVDFYAANATGEGGGVVIDRVFDDDDPERIEIEFTSIDEIRTGPEADDVEQVVWTRKPARQWVKVIFSEEALNEQAADLELGPFSQGVVIEDNVLKDVASGRQIAEVACPISHSAATREWVVPAPGREARGFKRCFIQPC